MEYLEIEGGARLGGEIYVHGAKNSALPILAASVLVKGESIIHNCPDISDVRATADILRALGAGVKREGSALIVNTKSLTGTYIPESMMQEMRSSIIFLGALASRMKEACVYLPGGCDIGLRPVDLHLRALANSGYDISFDGRNICCKGDNARAGKIVLSFPSVGATENAILASVFLKGKTTIINAAREPEIEDLADFLIGAGAKISGAGTTVIEIIGVDSLGSTEHSVIPDRILASTYMSAAAITGSELIINNINHIHNAPVYPAFSEMGCKIVTLENRIRIIPPERPKRVRKIETGAFPGFPTDSQAPIMAALSIARGSTIIRENIFENRFRHAAQLMRFGADITVAGDTAIINGVKALHGANANCTDLRGGAAIVACALAAQGTSIIKDISHIDRGYESIEKSLQSIGAKIKRKSDEKGS